MLTPRFRTIADLVRESKISSAIGTCTSISRTTSCLRVRRRSNDGLPRVNSETNSSDGRREGHDDHCGNALA